MLVGGGLTVWGIAGAEAAVGVLSGGASIAFAAITTGMVSLSVFGSDKKEKLLK